MGTPPPAPTQAHLGRATGCGHSRLHQSQHLGGPPGLGVRCGGPVGSDPPPPMEPPYQGSAGPPLRSALGRRPSFLRSQPRLPAWHLASHLGASPATRVEGVNWPWPPSSGLGRLSSANCGAKGSSPLGRHPHPTSSPRPSPDPPPPDQPGPRPLAASPSHQALLACVAPRPHQPHT